MLVMFITSDAGDLDMAAAFLGWLAEPLIEEPGSFSELRNPWSRVHAVNELRPDEYRRGVLRDSLLV